MTTTPGDLEIVAASYMSASMLRKADVHIQVDGAIFPAHSTVLEIACGVLRDAPDFANSTRAAPAVLSAPFSSVPRDEVEAFLRVLYEKISPTYVQTAAHLLGMIRLAHALDAQKVLARALSSALKAVSEMALEEAAAYAEFATLVGLADLCAACQCRLAWLVRDANNGSADLATEGGFLVAFRLTKLCEKEVMAGVIGALSRAHGIPHAAEIARNNRRAEAALHAAAAQ